jgi:hypothetical protein
MLVKGLLKQRRQSKRQAHHQSVAHCCKGRFGDSPEDPASEEAEPREHRGTDVLIAKQPWWP